MSNHIILTDQIMKYRPVRDWRGPTFSNCDDRNPVPVTQNPRFNAHSDLFPSDLFAVKVNRHKEPAYRFIRKDNNSQMLMFIDGACADNGTPYASAGWAVCWGPDITTSGRLEPEGGLQTNNRAELRAAIVALTLRCWPAEGFDSIVLAGDSEYVFNNYCKYLSKWKQDGWRMSAGRKVANKDLWQALDDAIQSLARRGAQVFFWKIPRTWNEADKYAKEATTEPPTEGSPTEPIEMSCPHGLIHD